MKKTDNQKFVEGFIRQEKNRITTIKKMIKRAKNQIKEWENIIEESKKEIASVK